MFHNLNTVKFNKMKVVSVLKAMKIPEIRISFHKNKLFLNYKIFLYFNKNTKIGK